MRSWAVIDIRQARCAATAVLVSATVLGWAQEDTPSRPHRAPPPALAQSTLTVKDMNKAFAKVEVAMRKVLHLPARATTLDSKGGSKPATRDQIVLRMDALFELARPSFKFTPKMISYDPSMITIKKRSAARKAVEKLIVWECVGKVGLLAAGLTPTLTLGDFGEELGIFVARLADLTHLPSNKWSPYLQDRSQHSVKSGPAKSSVPSSKR